MEDIKKIQESIAKLESGDKSALREIKDRLSDLLLHLQVKSVLNSIAGMLDTPANPEPVPLKEALDSLEQIATTKKDKDGKRTYLLHRLTADFEYDKYTKESRTYEPSESLEWWAEFNSADQAQDLSAPGGGANPVISCWVPETSIESFPNPLPNTGQWGDLGKNPHSHKYTVIVKPGKYEVYQELKE